MRAGARPEGDVMFQFYEPEQDYGAPEVAAGAPVSLAIDGRLVTVPAGTSGVP